MRAVPPWRWLESTRTLQRHAFGYDLDTLARGSEQGASPQLAGPLTKYLDWNTTAAVQELAELREEFSWKPWAQDQPFVNRQRVLAEAVDALHFIGNILVGMGVSDEELEAAYVEKQRINVSRMASGNYSAKKGGLSQGSD